MAATKKVQISTMGDKDFPIFSAKVIDEPAKAVDAIVLQLTGFNPAITADQCLQAIWDEGIAATQAKLTVQQLPGRLASLRIVTPPPAKPEPRPIR